MTDRKYSSNAQPTTLSADINNSTTTIPVVATTGFPATPFILAISPGEATQELVLVTAVAGLNLTATRGYDSSTAQSHSLGAAVRHSHAGIDFRDSRNHENASTGVHGVTGAVVGTTDTQALTHKDLSSATNTFPSTLATDAEVSAAQAAAVATAAVATATVATNLAAHAADTSTHGVAVAIVGTTEAQTLTNKTLALGSNTVSGTTAQFNAANTDGDFATLAGSETLSNKTLAAPVFSGDYVGSVKFARKAGSESVTSSTTFQDDDDLTFTVEANSTYEVTGVLSYDGDAAGGLKLALVGPTGYAVNIMLTSSTVLSMYETGDTANFGTSGATIHLPMDLQGLLRTSSTAGTFKVRWAQSSSSATPTRLLTDSYLTLRKVA